MNIEVSATQIIVERGWEGKKQTPREEQNISQIPSFERPINPHGRRRGYFPHTKT
jgi:hypothetical protein